MVNILRQALHSVEKGCERAIGFLAGASYRLPRKSFSQIPYTEVEVGQLSDPSRGRGQLREGNLRSNTREGIPEGRPLDYVRNVDEDVPTIQSQWDWAYGDYIRAVDRQVGGNHYKDMPIQPHYFCHVNKLGPLESNVIKYICRHHQKGEEIDLEKAKHYIDLLMEWEYGNDQSGTAPPTTSP